MAQECFDDVFTSVDYRFFSLAIVSDNLIAKSTCFVFAGDLGFVAGLIRFRLDYAFEVGIDDIWDRRLVFL